MLAELQPAQGGYVARFERQWHHAVEDVWSWLTENDKLVQWFPELEIAELREGGVMKFHMPDGTTLTMDILAFTTNAVFAFTWDKDSVRFELHAKPDGGCQLIFSEHIHHITAHTARDLAGWHVCLDVIAALMDGTTIASRKELWNSWYEKYKALTEPFLASQA